MARCSSGTAAIISTSFGARDKPYLREICDSGGGNGLSVSGWVADVCTNIAELQPRLLMGVHMLTVTHDCGRMCTQSVYRCRVGARCMLKAQAESRRTSVFS